jgi:hypothetical protein
VPLDEYLVDASLTDKGWFDYNDIVDAWRQADMIGEQIYALAYQGEMTMQIHRKDLYDAKGLKPAETLNELGDRDPHLAVDPLRVSLSPGGPGDGPGRPL